MSSVSKVSKKAGGPRISGGSPAIGVGMGPLGSGGGKAVSAGMGVSCDGCPTEMSNRLIAMSKTSSRTIRPPMMARTTVRTPDEPPDHEDPELSAGGVL